MSKNKSVTGNMRGGRKPAIGIDWDEFMSCGKEDAYERLNLIHENPGLYYSFYVNLDKVLKAGINFYPQASNFGDPRPSNRSYGKPTESAAIRLYEARRTTCAEECIEEPTDEIGAFYMVYRRYINLIHMYPSAIDRRILLLRLTGEKTIEEIAEAINYATPSVKGRLKTINEAFPSKIAEMKIIDKQIKMLCGMMVEARKS